MARKSAFTKETLELARKLREQDGKTFSEISAITGISETPIKRAAQKYGWKSDQNKSRKETEKKITKLKQEHHPTVSEQPEKTADFISELSALGLMNPAQYASKGLMIGLEALMKIGIRNGDVKALTAATSNFAKLCEMTNAFDSGEEQRKLNIYIPQITEVYEDPPDGEADNDSDSEA